MSAIVLRFWSVSLTALFLIFFWSSGGTPAWGQETNYLVSSYTQLDQKLGEWVLDGAAAGIAAGPGGEIYVNINQNYRVVKYSPCGDMRTSWGVACDGCNDAALGGIAVGSDGRVYVTINNSHRVVAYTAEGEKLTEWALDGEPAGIAVGPGGEVFVNINQNYRVVAYSPAGERLNEWALEGEPGGIAVSPLGHVYVTINNSHRVIAYSTAGEKTNEWALEGKPLGIAVGSDGVISVNINQNYREDNKYQPKVNINQNYRVVQYSAAGEMLGSWAVGCNNCGVIETNGLTVNSHGWVYVPLSNQPAAK